MGNNTGERKRKLRTAVSNLEKTNILSCSRDSLFLAAMAHYTKACNEFAGPVFASLRLRQRVSYHRYGAAAASGWQICIQFERLEI